MARRGKPQHWIGGVSAAALLWAQVVAAVPALTSGRIRIVRDSFGVPHVYASTVRDLFTGYGYVAAQDRLFQLEMAKRATQGTVVEVLGSAYADSDVSIRKNFTPASVRRQVEALPAADREVLQG